MSIKLRLAAHKIFNDAGQRYVSGAFADGQDRYLCAVDGWVDIKITPRPRRGRGRPPGSRLKPKDVAMYLCCNWLQVSQGLSKNAALDRILDLFVKSNGKHYSSDRAVRRPIDLAEKMLPRDGLELMYSGEGDEGRLAIILDNSNSLSVVNNHMVIDGTGWVWAYPEPIAEYVHMKGGGGFSPASDAFDIFSDMGVTIK